MNDINITLRNVEGWRWERNRDKVIKEKKKNTPIW